MRRVRGLKDARAALMAGECDLISEPFAACHAGVNYYHAMLQRLRREFPANDFRFTLCCGDDAAIAHDAVRMGFMHILCDCGEEQFNELRVLAGNTGRVQRRIE